MALNYTGPSAVGKLLHGLDHYDTALKKIFVPTSPTQPFTDEFLKSYQASLIIFFVLLLLMFLVIFFFQCCVVRCCEWDFCCCVRPVFPPWRSTPENEDRVKPKKFWVIAFSYLFVCAAALTTIAMSGVGYVYNHRASDGLNVVNNATQDSYNIYLDLVRNGDSLLLSTANCTASVDDILNSGRPLPNSTRDSLLSVKSNLQGATKDSQSYQKLLKDNDYGSNRDVLQKVDQARSSYSLATISLLLISAVFSVLTALHCLCNIQRCRSPAEDNCRCSCFCTFRVLIVFIFFFVWVVAALSFSMSVAVSDFCMDPPAWSKALAAKGEAANSTHSTKSQLVDFYMDCQPVSNHPFAPPLNQASSKINSSRGDVQNLVDYARTVDPTLLPSALALQSSINQLQTSIDSYMPILDCRRLHDNVFKAFEGVCHPFLEGAIALVGVQLLGVLLIMLSWPSERALRFYRASEQADAPAHEEGHALLDHSGSSKPNSSYSGTRFA
eukprot:TRINITY_DN264_c0_g1_i1.p1 TRINITY_DN264_c0_g1~~TRINITY_DN264_c0_g1_i1.p1  ORF type:complete len:497 (-),score=173.63 TRINITY_DN264_c0_g1_i1:50-1540(-)